MMIDAKAAIQSAKVGVKEMLGLTPIDVEEIERDEYKSRDVWSITLSFPRSVGVLGTPAVAMMFKNPENYYFKRVLVDRESGEVLSIKMR
jgi:hypothetical protein